MSKIIFALTLCFTFFILTGCVFKKDTSNEEMNQLSWTVVNTWIVTKTWMGIIDTGIQDSFNDKNFDPKTYEDKEINDLMNYIEKVVEE